MTIDLPSRNEFIEFRKEVNEKMDAIQKMFSSISRTSPLLKPNEVRKDLNCCNNTLNLLIADGTLTPIKFGGQNRFKAEEVEKIKRGA